MFLRAAVGIVWPMTILALKVFGNGKRQMRPHSRMEYVIFVGAGEAGASAGGLLGTIS
jgi:hypothetical protein